MISPRTRTVLRFLAAAGLLAACHPDAARQEGSATAPRRIVTWAPNLTEAVVALGLTDRLVATDDFSLHTAEIAALPKLGGLFNPNLERLTALKPDLMIVLPSNRDVARQAEALHIPVLVVPSENLLDVENGLRAIAARCGVADRGEEVARRFHQDVAPRDVARGRRVLLVAGRAPGRFSEVVAAGPGTFLSELAERLGAVNVFSDVPTRWPQVSVEEIVARQPEVILELSSDRLDEARRAATVAEWSTLPSLEAARSGRVFVIDGDFTLVPGPRLGMVLQEFERVLGSTP
jgi:iron complex transport system substrate-binding protein